MGFGYIRPCFASIMFREGLFSDDFDWFLLPKPQRRCHRILRRMSHWFVKGYLVILSNIRLIIWLVYMENAGFPSISISWTGGLNFYLITDKAHCFYAKKLIFILQFMFVKNYNNIRGSLIQDRSQVYVNRSFCNFSVELILAIISMTEPLW